VEDAREEGEGKVSMFFSEEKNQKTFDSAPVRRSGIWPESGAAEDDA
jgi:hypothetical protein